MTVPTSTCTKQVFTPPPTTVSKSRPPTRVFLACSGLGTIRRGYETFMRGCFESLRHHAELDVQLYKGAGASGVDERPLHHLPRDGAAAHALAMMTGRGSYVIEQASFAASLLPHVVRERPDVIYFCDPAIGKVLSKWRQLRSAPYRLVFHNSGPIAPPFPWFDHIHQVSPAGLADAVAAGESLDRQTLLPCGLDIGAAPTCPSDAERAARRRALGFPASRPVVLSVGALNRAHKRMDYVIKEVASLPEPRPYLVMLGQSEGDTPILRTMATLLLGEQGFAMRSVGVDEIGAFYQAADVFTLASLQEGFGLGYVEALAHGLPCIAHDFTVSRYVLGDHGFFADLRTPGTLANALRQILASGTSPAQFRQRHASVAERFSWPALNAAYVEMMRSCAVGSIRRTAPLS
jgi:1,2-diacylglycerol 3-alpha-glucosyltransferase